MHQLFVTKLFRGSERNVITLASLFILCAGLIASVIIATNLSDQNKLDRRSDTVRQLDAITSQVNAKIDGYNQLLISGAALLRLNPDTSKGQWKAFVADLKPDEQFPSILGMGYVEYFPSTQLEAHEARIQTTGVESYHIWPTLSEAPRNNVSGIVYLEPESDANKKAIGYDMYSDETRQKAMQAAIDTGHSAISAPVQLVQFANKPKPSKGILVYYPIYSTLVVPDTVEERREKAIGFTYLVVLPQTFVDILSNVGSVSQEDIRLSDISEQPPARLNSRSVTDASSNLDAIQVSQIVRAANRVWRVAIPEASPNSFQRWLPLSIFGVGTFLSIIISSLIFRSLVRRLKRLTDEYDQKIQETKNDMLALASHQLRTPASGVKQYLGMLTQGFIGDLSEQQLKVAEKAYAANERQLEIINQMLYVAKADAGQLLVEPEKIDLLEMARTALNLQKSTATNKNISLELGSKKSTPAYGDSRYVAMIIDNLISNAIKYTQADKKVTVRVFLAEKMSCLSVSDEGVGIHESDLPKVFEKFSRLENPLSKSEGGNGLGLYLAHGLAEAHGGSLEVTSELGIGSTFILSLPRTGVGNQKIRVNLDQATTKYPKNTGDGV
ncbi:CHASE domain-containing protein [Candidatus Saccharibacteria bacterium]|nr:CHASE domain-containing protein [Candidatus Saccharibacteria bacterium]